MERKTGFAVAGAVAMVLVAGAIAAGANLGLLRSGDDSPAGKLTPADAASLTAETTPQEITVEVRDPSAPGASTAPAGAGDTSSVQVIEVPVGTASSAGGTSGSDDDEFEDEHEDERDDDREHEDEHEHEDERDDDGSDSDD